MKGLDVVWALVWVLVEVFTLATFGHRVFGSLDGRGGRGRRGKESAVFEVWHCKEEVSNLVLLELRSDGSWSYNKRKVGF